MTSRTPSAVVTLLLIAVVTGCGGRGGGPGTPGSTPASEVPVPGSYNSDQLTQALLTEIPGYERSGMPQWGQYSSLAAVQNYNEMQQAVKLDKPQCASTAHALSQEKAVQTAPSALVAFERGQRRSVTETLMAVGPAVAAQQVKIRVPAACRTFRVRIGRRWASNAVVETTGTRIGEGSRTAGVSTTVGLTTVSTWFVVLRSRGYLAAITLYGPGATRDDAERIARQAYQQAERILP